MAVPVTQNSRMSAAEWHSSLPRAVPVATPDAAPFGIRRLVGTPALVTQPALNDDIVCLHLGGAKRVHRWNDGKATIHDVAETSVTIMPRAIENRWRTIGPVDYLHIVLRRDLLEGIAAEVHDVDPARLVLRDVVGIRHPLLEASFAEMYRLGCHAEQPGRLRSDSLMTVFLTALIGQASSVGDTIRTRPAEPQCGGLGGWRMRRVIDYMESHYAFDVDLAQLTALTGLSRAHFYRAFRQSTGTTPARHLDGIRAERAAMLLAGDMPMADVAFAVGLSGTASLAAIFLRHFGIGPREYRRAIR
jgi:AraC family transcriptional regulator